MKFSIRQALLMTAVCSSVLCTFPKTGYGVPIKEDVTASVSPFIGLSTASDNIGSGVGYGVEGTYFIRDSVGVGAFLRSANHDLGISSFFFGGQGIYRFTRALEGLQLGVLLGSGKFTRVENDIKQSFNNAFAYGAKAAYDVPITKRRDVTVGADLNLLFFKPGSDTVRLITPTVMAKYWF